MARITKAQIIEATKVAVRMDPKAFNRSGTTRCRKRSRYPLCKCTREKYHSGPHVCVYYWVEQPVKRVWFSADQRMKDMYEHYRDSQSSTPSQSVNQHLDSKEV